jgi:putative transposase
MQKSHLYVHVIWTVKEKKELLSRPIRTVLFTHLQKSAEEKGIRILSVNGGTDHIHVMLHLHPAQNVSQVVRQLKAESTDWLNSTQLISGGMDWEEDFASYSVSPSQVKQVVEYLDRQETYHLQKSFDAEIEIFNKVQIG